MSIWSTLGKIGLGVGNVATGGVLGTVLGAGGAGLGAAANASANNRGEKFSGQLDLQRLLMDRDQQNYNNQLLAQQEGRTSGSDAWKKLLSTSHTLTPVAHTQLSPYSVAPRMATDAETTGAQALQAEALKRLTGGSPISAPTQSPLQVDPKLLNPGLLEKIFGISSPILSGIGGLSAPKPKTPSVLDSLNV